MCLNGLVQLPGQGQQALIKCAQTVNPKGPGGSRIQVDLDVVGMLMLFSAVNVAFDSFVSILLGP